MNSESSLSESDKTDNGKEETEQEDPEAKGQDPVGIHGDVLHHREGQVGEGVDTNKSKTNKNADGKQTSAGGTTKHAHQRPVCIQHAGGQGTFLSDGRDTRDGRQDGHLNRHEVI